MLMAVMVREAWTDERLDDLNKKVDGGFARLDRDIRELRGEMKELRGEIKELRGEIVDCFEAQNRTLVGGFFVLIAAMIGSNAF
jgi:hypothetical protein